MKRCNNCLMPDTKPGLVLNENGICQACIRAEAKKNIDYVSRQTLLRAICDTHRLSGYYDCLVPVSGGKDSHYQVGQMKDTYGMNPLLVMVADPFTKTKAGIHNINNIQKVFDCDLITIDMSPVLCRDAMRYTFETYGNPTWVIDRAIYTVPLLVAFNMKIPLVVYGENISWEYGGVQSKEIYSAKDQINNTVARAIQYEEIFGSKHINMLNAPRISSIEPIYLSYFENWSGHKNYGIAKNLGFKSLGDEWEREGYVEDYDQIDSIGYLMNIWMKYPKFGFARVTDVVGYWIREDRMTTEEGRKLIEEHDHKLDPRILDDFLGFTGYTEKQFWDIVEKFWNKDIFEKKNNKWITK